MTSKRLLPKCNVCRHRSGTRPAVVVGSVSAGLNELETTLDIDAIYVDIGQEIVPAVVVGGVLAGLNDFETTF